ncbi:hypothetical protein CRUP_010485 [Coryphaenoides rupestris]|nr:hypothetical protein CRUP_010485 [Coryphaenoides rupestris]
MEGRPLSSSFTERLLKVIVIGDLGVGKTSIIRRYVDELFAQTYKATVGVDFSLKTVEWDARTVLRLQFWDIAGQERFKRMSRVYYKGSTGALVVFDVSRRGGPTLRAAADWKRDLDCKVLLDNGDPVPAVLLANNTQGHTSCSSVNADVKKSRKKKG